MVVHWDMNRAILDITGICIGLQWDVAGVVAVVSGMLMGL